MSNIQTRICIFLMSCSVLFTMTSCFSNRSAHRNHTQNTSTQQTGQTQFVEYDCTRSYISNDPSFGHYNTGGGCTYGTASMEKTDHQGNIYEAMDYCNRKGLRLPTYHEMSAAGNFSQQLGLSAGDYWATSSKNQGATDKSCSIPSGKCSTQRPKTVLNYRCVQ